MWQYKNERNKIKRSWDFLNIDQLFDASEAIEPI